MVLEVHLKPLFGPFSAPQAVSRYIFAQDTFKSTKANSNDAKQNWSIPDVCLEMEK